MYKNKKVINGKTKKEIINYFYAEFMQEINYNYFSNCFITSDTNETISMNRFGFTCMLTMKKGNRIVEREYTNGKLTTKKYFVNNNFSCCTGPAIIRLTGHRLGKAYYYINGVEYSRKQYRKFVKNALKLKSFNKYKNLKTLEKIGFVLEAYHRVEQLKALNKRIELLKVTKCLEDN